MAGTRNAPDATGAATSKLVSFHWIDVSGDVRTDSYRVPVAATAAQIEAMADALQPGSHASLYGITVASEWMAIGDASNAEGGDKSQSVKDQLFFLAKNSNPLIMPQRAYFPAPIAGLFVADSDSLDPTAAETVALLTAFLALIGAGYSIVHGRYTERTEINEKTPI